MILIKNSERTIKAFENSWLMLVGFRKVISPYRLKSAHFISISAVTAQGIVFRETYSIMGFNDPSYFQPVFIVNPNIVLPDQLGANGIARISYPINCSIELSGSVELFEFDVVLVTDEGL
jgi:hypothetical protein